MKAGLSCFLLVLAATVTISTDTGTQYICSNGCYFNYPDPNYEPWVMQDNDDECTVYCGSGLLTATLPNGTTITYPSNYILCYNYTYDEGEDYADGIEYEYEYEPWCGYGYAFTNATGLGATLTCALPATVYRVNQTTSFACNTYYEYIYYSSTTGTTTLSTTVATEIIMIGNTTEIITVDTELETRCMQVVINNITYENRCVVTDTSASCNNNGTQIMCTCSANFTDVYCSITTGTLDTVMQIFGNATEPAAVLSMITSAHSGSNIFNANLPSILSFLTDSERASLGYSVSDMIMAATFEGKALVPARDFTTFNDPSLGNCFTFNHYNSSFYYAARNVGQRSGLRVIVNVQSDEYCPWVDTVGINVYIASVGTDVYIESIKYTSMPGGEDDLMLVKSTLQRLKARRFGICAKNTKSAQSFYFGGNYSIDGCYRSCYQDAVYSACGCMDPSYVRKAGVAECDYSQMTCIANKVTTRGDPSTWSECRCPQPCYEEDYDIIGSRASHNNFYMCPNNTDPTATCKTQLSTVVIAFNTLEVQYNQEEERYPVSDIRVSYCKFSRVLGMIGGVGGMLLGLSMLFLVECILLCREMYKDNFGREEKAPARERRPERGGGSRPAPSNSKPSRSSSRAPPIPPLWSSQR